MQESIYKNHMHLGVSQGSPLAESVHALCNMYLIREHYILFSQEF